jgi:predicted type IV restriction endonuclease
MLAPQAVLDLISRFENNYDAYTSGQYNETQLRREFLDPFFEALGWDIANKSVILNPIKTLFIKPGALNG